MSKISDHEHRIEQLKSQISLLEAERGKKKILTRKHREANLNAFPLIYLQDSQSQTIQNHVEEIKSIGDQLQSTQNQYQDLYAYCNSVIEENKKLKHEGETTAASHHSLVVEHNTAILSVIQELGIDENVDQSTPINSLVEVRRKWEGGDWK